MKISISILTFVLALCASANNPKYISVMEKNIPAMFQASDPEALKSVINQLVRIGDAEKDQWEPYYYASFGYIRLMQMEKDKAAMDKWLDLSLEMIGNGEKLNPNNSELESLRGFTHMMRLTVEPATRGQQYSGMAFNSFKKAVQLNPENPRALFLMGQMELGTAQFFGGGDGGSCETFRNALSFVEAEKKESSIAPSWGKEGITEALKACEN